MVDLIAEDVHDERVLQAMRDVPRHEFVPAPARPRAYDDVALAIGSRQTISQPVIVALMTAALALRGGEHVLEVGTGSGYQAAVLARIAATVVTVERIDALRERAEETLRRLGITNVRCLPAAISRDAPDAARAPLGAPAEGPYNGIAVTAAAPAPPPSLLDQLRVGGRMVVPVGNRSHQDLLVVTRTAQGIQSRAITPCRFVPLIGVEGFAARP
jgi:protein-L-isoaspartate(D-aspartate) O-methyltransferase